MQCSAAGVPALSRGGGEKVGEGDSIAVLSTSLRTFPSVVSKRLSLLLDMASQSRAILTGLQAWMRRQ